MESLKLLKSSLTISEGKVTLLDPEHFSEEFKEKIYSLFSKGMSHKNQREINIDNSAAECVASGVCERVQEDFSLDLKALNIHEKDYIVHLSCVHLQLAHQRNQLLHWFYLPAMAALAVRNYEHPVSEGMCCCR